VTQESAPLVFGEVAAKGALPGLLLPVENEGFIVPSQVNYVVKGGPILQPGEPITGAYSVVSRYLSTGYLWDTVRVMGGAYGGFARFGGASGRFAFLSYRDPNLVNTLKAYDQSAEAMLEAVKAGASQSNPTANTEGAATGLTKAALLQAVIGTVGDMDSPMSPDAKGFTAMARYLSGETAEERQKYRDQVLDTSTADFVQFAEKLSALKSTGSVVVVGSESALNAANAELPEGSKLTLSQTFGR